MDELVSMDNSYWQVVGRGGVVEVGYPCGGVKYRPLMWYLVPDIVAKPSLEVGRFHC